MVVKKEDIIRIIHQHKSQLKSFEVKKIGLFGSYVRGEQTNKSDIDILIDFDPEKETFDNFMTTYDYLENLFPDKKVEITTNSSLSQYIGPHILKEVEYA